MRAQRMLVLLLMPALAAAQESPWFRDLAKAKAAAKEKNLAVLALFTISENNAYCTRYRVETFEQQEFLSWAKDKFVLLQLDFAQTKLIDDATRKANEEIKATYKVKILPTVVFLDAEGQAKAKIEGFVGGGPSFFFKEANKQLYAHEAAADAAKSGGDPAKEPEKKEPEKREPYKPVPHGAWMTSWTDALAKAKKEKKPIVLNFTNSDDEQFCNKLKEQVLDQPPFQKWADKRIVLVEIDDPSKHDLPDDLKKQKDKLVAEFKVTGCPTTFVLDQTGKKLGVINGYDERDGPEAWRKRVDALSQKR